MFGWKASFETEISAVSGRNPTYGAYIAEIQGKGTFEVGPLQLFLQLKFNPNEPWFTKYKV